jgi:polar amino acid transport system substrate-binding protein
LRRESQKLRPLVLGLSGLLLLLFGLGAVAQTNEPLRSPFTDVQRVLDAGMLVVAMHADDIPAMIESRPDGQLEGIDVTLAHGLAATLGVALEVDREATSYDGIIEKVRDGQADLGISLLSRTVHRAMQVYFSRPYLRQAATLLVNRREAVRLGRGCPSLAAVLDTKRGGSGLGVLAESAYAEAARKKTEKLGTEPPHEYETIESLAGAVSSGEVVASLQGGLRARYYLRTNPAAAIPLRICELPDVVDHIAIAVRPDAPNLLRFVDIWLENRQVIYEAAQVASGEAQAALESRAGASGLGRDTSDIDAH